MLPKAIRNIPWATFGRRESLAELTGKWEDQKARLPYLGMSSPGFSFIVAVTKTCKLEALIASLLAQSYNHWELWIVVDPSIPVPKVTKDKRIHLVKKNGTEVELKNWGIQLATLSWLGFLEPNSLLSPVALFLMCQAVLENQNCSAVFANEI